MKGSKLEDGKLVVDKIKKKTDEKKHNSEITMELIQQVAEQVHPMIQLLFASPGVLMFLFILFNFTYFIFLGMT